MTDNEPTKDIPNPQELSKVVQGTAENLLNRLEENLTGEPANGQELPEELLLTYSHPGPLDKDGKNVEDVLNIISQSILHEGEGHILLKLCDRSSLLSVVSHSLSAYITTLEPLPLQRLSARIASEVSLWVCHLFRFTNGAAFCHDDTREGLVKITRMALHQHYPKMCQDGFEALFSRPPVIYLTSNTYVDIAHYVCMQLGLPLSTVRILRPETDKEEMVESIFQEDKAAGRLPILCIANVHSSLFQSLSPSCFENLCRRNNVWLHLEGHALAALALLNSEAENPPTADSLSLTLGSWIGVPAVPFVTMYKIVGLEEIANQAGLATVNPSVRLNCLPLWCVLRSLGEDQFKFRINNIFEMMEVLNNKMAEFSSIRILSQRPEQKEFISVHDIAKIDFELDNVFKTVSPALAFQYVSNSPPDPNERVPDYFNNLNSWLGQTMQRDCGQIPLEIVDVETTGYVLRLCPFESLAFSGVSLTDDDLEAFIIALENQTSILNATVCQRKKFIDLISREEKLDLVEIPHWAGLGGVCYIPPELQRPKSNEETDPEAPKVFTDEELQLINHRNLQLVNKLRSNDSAFSLGDGADGRMCIRFGMVSMETDVEELLGLVLKSGTDLDDKVYQLQNMSELVKKGIEQAQTDLRKESDDLIWQEGILRHVPLVGSIYNWISPAQKLQVKGRTLSLNEGRLHTTDEIFKSPPPPLPPIPSSSTNLQNGGIADEETEKTEMENPKQEIATDENIVAATKDEETITVEAEV